VLVLLQKSNDLAFLGWLWLRQGGRGASGLQSITDMLLLLLLLLIRPAAAASLWASNK
jgi:hypothetical protein